MQVICVSRGSYSRGREFAEALAKKLGYKCLGREDLVEEAVKAGIAVSKLELAMTKQAVFSERLAPEKEHYQALLASILCERALRENIVYHGWTGHLLLRGIAHVLRLRVVADMEYRVKAVMQRTRLDRKGSLDFIEKVEEDRRRWASCFYGVEWDASSHYDVILNLEQLGVENAAAAMCAVAALPEFQPTPASLKAMQDLRLGARARVALARHEATRHAQLKVQATGGAVSVTYLPQQAGVAESIPEILKGVEGVREIVCTVASTNILWIAESYSPDSGAFGNITQIAEKWNAAVELLRLLPADEGAAEGRVEGVESEPADDGGAQRTVAELIERGRAGGTRTVRGGQKALVSAIDPRVPYSLIVIGDVFLSKGRAARLRLARELAGFLFEKLRRPAVMAEELAVQYLFGPRQLVSLVLYALATLAVYAAVFSHQAQVLSFLQMGGKLRILAVIAVLLFVPSIAYVYGSAAKLALKMIKME
ncbi:MAG: cytidylate kinase-like family protein [Elusimicrobiota bacterium]